ncbi:hypothetical protein [Atopobium sp. oral taxon 416]|uniref:hypothetical protein n=1 Tax=Atopobium sp. oral taxon 416 TaxID=712157 RepID=UPI001BAC3B0C|nr:hypothetical protein [Atopobium sp. oral taxon 416]QUC02865.1 hypothetical protein J4859_12760 [Atopobium sp. oral taxon 416]
MEGQGRQVNYGLTARREIVTAKFPLDEFTIAMEHAAVKSYHNIKVLLDMDD